MYTFTPIINFIMRLYTNTFGGLFLWIFIGTTLAISYHSYIFYQSDSLEKHISEVIENEINAVKSHITKSNASTLTADIEFTFLNVEMYRQDSIVFWHRKMPNRHSSKSKKIESFVHQNDSIILFLDIFNPNGQLNPILANRLDLPFDIILTQDKSKYTFQFYGQTYTYAKKPFTLSSSLITLWWLM